MRKVTHDAATFSRFAISEADVIGGRYGAISKTTVTGSSGPVEYPRQPPDSPWATDPVGPEPPINFQEISTPGPVGERFEIELGEVRDGGSSQTPAAAGHPLSDEACSGAGQTPPVLVEPASSPQITQQEITCNERSSGGSNRPRKAGAN